MLRTPDLSQFTEFMAAFQWAPTLGGECYTRVKSGHWNVQYAGQFQWAPTLGGECYESEPYQSQRRRRCAGFNGHPPLGVNATLLAQHGLGGRSTRFNGHPPLGGECYQNPNRTGGDQHDTRVSMGTHPWGVNATKLVSTEHNRRPSVSMGTHPWG